MAETPIPSCCSPYIVKTGSKSGNPVVQISRIPPQFGVFFDGTGNNRHNDLKRWDDADDPTNVAKLFETYSIDSKAGKDRIYVDGVGTASDKQNSNLDMAIASSFGTRLEFAIENTKIFFKRFSNAPIGLLDVFGFSRGAAAARAFVNEVHKINNTEPRFWGGPKLCVRFLGVFDTVGSIGMPGDNDNDPFILDIHPEAVSYACHITAYDERREYFPCSSLLGPGGSSVAPHFEEIVFRGAHSDIGGGYGPTPQTIYYPSDHCLWNTTEDRDRQVEKLKAKLKKEYETKYHWPGINIDFEPRDEEGGDTLSKTYIYPYWKRDVKPQLAHHALRKMHQTAINQGVPLLPLEELLRTKAFKGQPAERVHALPGDLESVLPRVQGGAADRQAVDYLLKHYVHHSHQFAAGPHDMINSNKPEAKPKFAAPNKQREIFYNNIDRAHSPKDVWERIYTEGAASFEWIKKNR